MLARSQNALRGRWENFWSSDQVCVVKAVDLDPDPDALYGRGVMNCILHRSPEAIADLSQAIEIHPRFPAALSERGLAHVESGDIDRGMQDYDTALRIDPADPGLSYKLHAEQPRDPAIGSQIAVLDHAAGRWQLDRETDDAADARYVVWLLDALVLGRWRANPMGRPAQVRSSPGRREARA